MKGRLRNSAKIALSIAILVSSSYGFVGLGLRAGIGQFVPQDSTFEDSHANMYSFEVRYHLGKPFFLQAGTKMINVDKANLPITASPAHDATIVLGAYEHRLDALEAYGGIGLGHLLGKASTGIYPYILGSAGFISPIVSQRVEYYVDGDTTTSMFHVQEERRWASMVDLSAGVEAKIIGIGVFVQGDYILGRSVSYEPVVIDGVELFPGGQIEMVGWAISIGISID